MIEKRDFYINGAWVPPVVARDHDVIDPSTEDVCAIISLGDQADTDAAVAAATAAFPAWAATPPEKRAEYVKGILAQYEARVEEMAEAISIEMGAPIDMAGPVRPPACRGIWKTRLRHSRTLNGSVRWARTPRTTGSRWSRSASSA